MDLPELNRREFLQSSLAVSAALFLAPAGAPQGRLLGTLPLTSRGAQTAPLNTLIGVGLDARQFLDLSPLTPNTLVTPTGDFYVRTRCPDRLDRSRPWTVGIRGLVRRPVDVSLVELERLAAPMGTVLLECAGNTNPNNFGLMSAAAWTGVSLRRVLARVIPLRKATRVLVSGFDDHSQPSRSSVAGASWIFTFEQLEAAGAFLATDMNGKPLSPDHGFPVRLVVPRWYGCACIKWVNEILLVDEEAPVTSQMREFAGRTFQDGQPELARDYAPATIDLAATAVRVEKWLVDGHIVYRVIGVMWGGARPTNALMIRFKSTERWTRVESCPLPPNTATWTMWSHTWRPDSPGSYQVVLRADDPAIPTGRLDIYFYLREVRIDEV